MASARFDAIYCLPCCVICDCDDRREMIFLSSGNLVAFDILLHISVYEGSCFKRFFS